ncbi:hypothetical protein [Streptomyces sp. NPDC101115]|uniref:hypothetical protein n=1 Tax=Streptomyces sp. NPDC101115 TaxID=3366106 RepID=UPI00380BC33F
MLERAGRVDEAILILGKDTAERRCLTQNTLTAYAELLARHGRIAVAEPGFSRYDCSNLLGLLVHLLHERPQELLHLLDHSLTVPHQGDEEFQHSRRAFALAGLGRVEEAMAVVEAHSDPWSDTGIARAGPSSTAGRLAAAAAELRDVGTVKAREELFEVLVQQGQAAGAMAAHLQGGRTAGRRSKAPFRSSPRGRVSLEPPF